MQGRLPNDQGFDEWWGIPNSWVQSGFTSYPMYDLMVKEILAKEGKTELLNVPPHVSEDKKGEESKPAMDLDMKVRPVIDAGYLIPKTVAFIKKQAAEDKPFFDYLGYSEMDYRVGQLLDGIKEAGVEDNTIVVLSSDKATGGLSRSAGANGGSKGPFRGDFFYTPFEGSMRVPEIVR